MYEGLCQFETQCYSYNFWIEKWANFSFIHPTRGAYGTVGPLILAQTIRENGTISRSKLYFEMNFFLEVRDKFLIIISLPTKNPNMLSG